MASIAADKKNKGLFKSIKSAFGRKKENSPTASVHDGASGLIRAAESVTASDDSDADRMSVPKAKIGKGFVNPEVFADDQAMIDVEVEGHTLHGRRAPMLTVNSKHLAAFDTADGMLMVSPFLPAGLRACEWKMSSFVVAKNLYSTKTSKVYHVLHQPSGTELALKCYSKAHMQDLQKIQALREIWFHSHLSHPNIISMYAAWMEKGQICLAIEYAPIGSAFRKLRKLGSFPEAVSAKYIIFKILCALGFLHEMGLIHRDIKPENILLTADGCKLADLGLVINHREEVANTCLGTFDYMAPELFALPRKSHPMQFKDDPNAKTCDEKVDVWAVGVLVYELVYGAAPFASKNTMQTVNLIVKGFSGEFPAQGKNGGTLSDAGKDFVLQTLRRDPMQRPSIRELLSHPWLAMYCKQTEVALEAMGQMSISDAAGEGWAHLLKTMVVADQS